MSTTFGREERARQQLDTLPVGTIIIDHLHQPWKKHPSGDWEPLNNPLATWLYPSSSFGYLYTIHPIGPPPPDPPYRYSEALVKGLSDTARIALWGLRLFAIMYRSPRVPTYRLQEGDEAVEELEQCGALRRDGDEFVLVVPS